MQVLSSHRIQSKRTNFAPNNILDFRFGELHPDVDVAFSFCSPRKEPTINKAVQSIHAN